MMADEAKEFSADYVSELHTAVENNNFKIVAAILKTAAQNGLKLQKLVNTRKDGYCLLRRIWVYAGEVESEEEQEAQNAAKSIEQLLRSCGAEDQPDKEWKEIEKDLRKALISSGVFRSQAETAPLNLQAIYGADATWPVTPVSSAAIDFVLADGAASMPSEQEREAKRKKEVPVPLSVASGPSPLALRKPMETTSTSTSSPIRRSPRIHNFSTVVPSRRFSDLDIGPPQVNVPDLSASSTSSVSYSSENSDEGRRMRMGSISLSQSSEESALRGMSMFPPLGDHSPAIPSSLPAAGGAGQPEKEKPLDGDDESVTPS